MKSLQSASLIAAASLALALSGARDAQACGGCFTVPSETESTVVSAHRMALAISTTHTVLWDQIQYTGAPDSFAWVLPIRAGATIEAASDAFFEVLEAATSARVVSPEVHCSTGNFGSQGCGIGCGALASAGGETSSLRGGTVPPVTVVHSGTVGPYETVTLHANIPNALPNWLSSHGYAVDPSISPIINDYVTEGFDFIALRLLPDKTVREMQPVRVITQGMSPVLPLRMVAAGTGPNVSVALFVISEGLYVPQNFPVDSVAPSNVRWDFTTDGSDYAEQRVAVLAKNNGRTWNFAYGRRGPFLSQISTLARQTQVTYTIGSEEDTTIAQAYVSQGRDNGQAVVSGCVPKMLSWATSADVVTNLCSSTGGGGGGGGGGGSGGAGAGGSGGGGGAPPNCASPGAGQIDMRDFTCGELDDLAVAFEGLHPRDIWLTRLEANLPHESLVNDLVLHAANNQVETDNWLYLDKYVGDPCAGQGTISASPKQNDRSMAALFGVTLFALAAAGVRRVQRLRRRR